MPDTQTLGDLAEEVRSKNAGPFWLTLDIFLATDSDYQRVDTPATLDEQKIADLYQVEQGSVHIYRLPDLRAIKISFPRPTVQGSFPDRDMHAGQQHIPLTTLPIPTKS